MPMDLPVTAIDPSPYQVRQEFADLEELAEVIRQHGFTSRIRVRPHPTKPDRYQLVYGERRLRAAKLAGLSIIPCDVAKHTDEELREIGLTENLQRQDLKPLEEARAFQVALDEWGYSMRSLAGRIGKSKGYIQNRLELLRAPQDVQQMVDTRADSLSAGLFIAQLDTIEQRHPLIEGVLRGELDAHTVRDMVRDITSASSVALPAVGPRAYSQGDDSVGHATEPSIAEQEPSQPDMANEAHVVDPRRKMSSEAIQSRSSRQSERSLAQATQTLRAMTAQLRIVVPQLQPRERRALRNFIVQNHFPELEGIIELLQE
jgi:ParB/RepB/Spo0J family partition protein